LNQSTPQRNPVSHANPASISHGPVAGCYREIPERPALLKFAGDGSTIAKKLRGFRFAISMLSPYVKPFINKTLKEAFNYGISLFRINKMLPSLEFYPTF